VANDPPHRTRACMTPDRLFSEFERGFPARKFTAGLLIAIIDFLVTLGVTEKGFSTYSDFLKEFPRQTTTTTGKRYNTLVVQKPDGKTLSLRGFYNDAERFYRAEQKRFDYPSAAPHATQAWPDYIPWIDALVTYDRPELEALRQRVNQFVLNALKSQDFDPASVEVEPPLFRLLLDSFDMTSRKGEPSGASLQGITFGFFRADNPHLQIEIDKVRTGSKRLQRIGDVDGWDGARLAISAEAKQFEIKSTDVSDFEAFANSTGKRGALGLVVATGFQEGVRATIEGLGLITLDVDDMLRIVRLWDPVKQRTAVQSFVYYARHVEKNSSLSERVEAFLHSAATDWTADRTRSPAG
jgi:hypothetical protein